MTELFPGAGAGRAGGPAQQHRRGGLLLQRGRGRDAGQPGRLRRGLSVILPVDLNSHSYGESL